MTLTKMKKPNLYLAFQWLIFLPIILPLCIVFGALQGVVNTVEQMAQQMWSDVSTVEKTVEPSELWVLARKYVHQAPEHFFFEVQKKLKLPEDPSVK